MTYGDLKSRIVDDTQRDDLQTQIARCVQSAIQYFQQDQYWITETQISIFTQAGQSTYALPGDFIEVIDLDVTYSNAKYDMIEKTWKELDDMDSTFAATPLAGTATASGSSTTLTGVATLFTTQLLVGDRVSLASTPNAFATVVTISSNLSLITDVILPAGTGQIVSRLRSSTLQVPYYFTIYSNSLRVYPVPDQVYTMTMFYQAAPSAPRVDTDGTNATDAGYFWTNTAEPMVRAWAKGLLYAEILADPDSAQNQFQMSDQYRRQLIAQTEQRALTGVVTPWE